MAYLLRTTCRAVYVSNSSSTSRAFSCCAAQLARKRIQRPALPEPSASKPVAAVPDNHPLWAFFRSDKATLTPPKDDAKHGRAWAAEELRRKSFDDLHALWITCLKERNILATQRHERRRQQIRRAGNQEASERDRTVRRTMAGIKFVLNERFLAWTEAVELAKADGTIEPQTSNSRNSKIGQGRTTKIDDTTNDITKDGSTASPTMIA